MRIKTIVTQSRRDMDVIYECEFCGHTCSGGGYDDNFFHKEVVPKMKCPKCGKKADAKNYIPRETKYPDGLQV